MKVIFAARARDDIDDIGMRIARENPERARSFVGELVRSAMQLADFPRRYPVVAEFSRLDLRKRVHGNYLIFYRVDPEFSPEE